MQQITVNVYSFNELSEDAKQKAIEKYRNKGIDADYIYDEAHNTVKEFNSLIGTNEGNSSWLNFNTNSISDDVLNLTGLRLRTYLINNYGWKLFKRAYLRCFDGHKQHRMIVNKKGKKKDYCFAYSNLKTDECCVLTGVCYDDNILKPIYDFIKNGHKTDSFKYVTFENLISDCFESLEKAIENEIEYLNSDESISEHLEINEYQFEEDGTIF